MKRLTLRPIFPREPPCLLVGLDELGDIPRRRAVDTRERVLDEPCDLEETNAPGEERRHGHLVRRVERARERAAALARLACEPSSGKRSRSGCSNSSVSPAVKSRPGSPGARALRIGERERDRHAHVRVPEMRERGSVSKRTSACTTEDGCTTTSIRS